MKAKDSITWQVIESSSGNLYIAVLENERVIYFGADFRHYPKRLRRKLYKLRKGEHPVRNRWKVQEWISNGDYDVQMLYETLIADEPGSKIVADERGVYVDRMSAATRHVWKM